MPSSPWLASRVALQATAFLSRSSRDCVIEIGAGTGAITERLVNMMPHAQFILVEADSACCRYLRRRFPHAEIIDGLVEELLDRLLAPRRRLVLVSSVPLISLNHTQRDRVLVAYEALVGRAAASRVVQYTYVPWLPGPHARWLCGGMMQPVWRNLPPAWVWSSTHHAFL